MHRLHGNFQQHVFLLGLKSVQSMECTQQVGFYPEFWLAIHYNDLTYCLRCHMTDHGSWQYQGHMTLRVVRTTSASCSDLCPGFGMNRRNRSIGKPSSLTYLTMKAN